MNEDLTEYQKKLNALLYSDSDAIFANYSQNHARCIIRTFLDSAESTAIFLSGDFGAGVYAEQPIRDAIIAAVRRGVDMRVVSLGQDESSGHCLEELAQMLDKQRNPQVCGQFRYRLGVVRANAQVQHYMVVDGKRYRLEAAHANPVPESVHAEVCCNGKAKAAVLSGMFNAVWGRLGQTHA